MERRVEIEVVGCVNGASVEAAGDGDIGGEVVRIELRATRSSLHWDHALLLQPLVDLLAFIPAADQEAPVAARVNIDIYDEDGREMGAMGLSALVSREDGGGDGVSVQVQIVRGNCRFEAGEEIVAVDEARRGEVTRFGVERVVATSAWSWRTGRGDRFWSVATVTLGSAGNCDGDAAIECRFEFGRSDGAVQFRTMA